MEQDASAFLGGPLSAVPGELPPEVVLEAAESGSRRGCIDDSLVCWGGGKAWCEGEMGRQCTCCSS